MTYRESIMELSNRQYDNPYKYNGKEMDSQTGLYYYGARYYDPQRSFWLSVDPLVETTVSPYAYTWNDPVNYTDPTGMIGERVGDPGGPNFFKKLYDWIFGDKPKKSSLTLGTITSSREPDLPWYLNEGDYGGKPVLTLGAHNIKFPYLQRDEYGDNVLEYGDTFIKNSLGAAYNGLASIWNDGMAGKEGAAIMYEGDSDMESAVRHMSRGNINAVEMEGLAGALIVHKVNIGTGKGKVIGLGLDEDLSRHRGTDAITWKDAKWQKEGLTSVRWEKVVLDRYEFRSSFKEAVENASGIRFDVTNFNPLHRKPGMTNFEFNHIINTPSLLQKTTFIKGGNEVFWNGTQFINK